MGPIVIYNHVNVICRNLNWTNKDWTNSITQVIKG